MTNNRPTNWNEVPVVLTVDEAARAMNVHPNTVRNLIRAGDLPARKIGREWRITKADVLAYLGQAEGGGGDE